MNEHKAPEIDLTICDREPIHIPGSIQPHGVMLLADPATLTITHAASDVEGRLGRSDWLGQTLSTLLGARAATEAERCVRDRTRGFIARLAPPFAAESFDALIHTSSGRLVIELEPTSDEGLSAALLPQIEAAAAAFEKAPDLVALCHMAAQEYRRLTGYGRIMIYRFLDDDAGVVVAESLAAGEHSFLNHHFPASDIPKQARGLYVRNLVRVIPDVHYEAAPLRPDLPAHEFDMSDCILRSVSPVHLHYLRNMQVGASASVSIVKDGVLWGLIACHNATPLNIHADVRAACRALAGGLARQIKAREETDAYRERVRLRSFEDDIVALLSREGSLDTAISNHIGELMRMLGSDGVAVLRGQDLVVGGRCPAEKEVRKLAVWAVEHSSDTVFATDRLAEHYQLPEADRAVAAGLLAITLSASEPWIVLWFRAEEVEVVNWAGNPHKNMTPGPEGTLNPRASFEAWTETVRGRARRWTLPEAEAAGRLRVSVMNVWQTRRMRDLNRQLLNTLDEKDLLLQQKEFLIGEVNHRVQNSLQLVSSFLALQGRASDDPKLNAAIDEARRRLSAVSLVHRRLYRADQLEAVDAARYADELLTDLVSSMGAEWERTVTRDLQPVMLPTDRAVGLGLVLTELVINANKYAYGGAAGPLRVTLIEDRNTFRLMVADQGGGRTGNRKGFGTRMMDALVGQLGGSLDYEDNKPGTLAVLVAPIEMPRVGREN
ncbi:histidine kinase [Terrihabitans soli]|uniref:Histidine kinase n=1 Tax=Terrihabitans soli TaxID=708113 RepID=A0A6S6QJ83_9HYPH|nr:histidine kinase dimerization/phosphoacceptor domain -containing protein [Terrihabitans soli]BCJ91323.1 histidine kinase [Terrihabitans soli]